MSITELYKQKKDLLSPFFASEEEAAACEERAKMGDDRAMRLLSVAYDAREREEGWKKLTTGSTSPLSPYGTKTYTFLSLDSNKRNSWHEQAIAVANPSALSFHDAVRSGERSIKTSTPEWQPDRGENGKRQYLVDYPRGQIPVQGKNWYGVIYQLYPAGSTRFELAELLDKSGEKSPFNILYSSQHPVKWPGDKRYEEVNSLEGVKDGVFDKRNFHALEECAKAGSAEAATILSRIYAKSEFYEIITKFRSFRPADYKANPLHDVEKAKYWERVAKNLSQETTPIEREKFLKEFLYSQDSMPEGLYNIGYALYHNAVIGNKESGLDYLKHAANLGDANAARELGEIYHNAHDNTQSPDDLQRAHFWYHIAADLGHANGAARTAYLEKADPDLKQSQLDENAERNPSAEHIKHYPAAAWHVQVKQADIGGIIQNTSHGSLTERLQHAVDEIDTQVASFETAVHVIQARIDDLMARQLVLDGRVEALKGEELEALRTNKELTEKQKSQERWRELGNNRWVQGAIANTGSVVALSMLMPEAAAGRVIASITSNTGKLASAMAENDHYQVIIDELESRKIDTSHFPDEIRELAEEVQRVADSAPMQQLLKDETRANALVQGYLRQRILKSGLENSRFLDEYAQLNGEESVDSLLEKVQERDDRLYQAVSHLCYGHADSNDMAVLLADVNAIKGNDLQPYEKALKQFVEHVVKENLGHYMSRASQIDVIADLGLIDFSTMEVDGRHATAELMKGTQELSADEVARHQVDQATKLALTSMFSSQFGVSHVGQYDVNRMFSYYLHRHGQHDLIAAELYDGQVSDERVQKRVEVQSPKHMRSFVERAKASAHHGREDQPDVGNLFLRVCGYEYFLPQAVITSGRGNRFKENPEAPVAYPMVNQVVQTFVEKMSLTDIAAYREQIGEELDGVIAQTFIDFFHEVGLQHAGTFAQDRGRLRDAHVNDNYGPHFNTYKDKITKDVLKHFPRFLEIYAQNLEKELQGAQEEEATLLREQIGSLHDNARQYLSPDVPAPGSHQDRENARSRDHRFGNMTEQWGLG